MMQTEQASKPSYGRFFDVYRDPVGWRVGLGVWLVNFLLNMGFVLDSGMTGLIEFFAITNLTGVMIGVALWPFFAFVEKQELMPITVLALLASAVATAIYLTILLSAIIPRQEPAIEYPSLLGPVQLIFLVYFAGYGLYSMVLKNRRVLAAQRSNLEQVIEVQKAKADSLRYQINPHFLFNALNACSALILDNQPKEARRLLNDLSDYYRAVIADNGEAFTSLQDEVALQMQYLEIEKVRFAERLQTEVTIEPRLQSARVPVLILQPLVENAVKHGVAGSPDPSRVRIGADAVHQDLKISISNPIYPGAGSVQPGTRTGLTNVHRRLSAIYGDRASVGVTNDDHFTVTLTMPLTFND